MKTNPVSKKVNNARNDGEDLIAPIKLVPKDANVEAVDDKPEPKPKGGQMDLF